MTTVLATSRGVTALVLQEFRLRAADTDGEVAALVAALPSGLEPRVPLLTNIDDPRDVATIRGMHAGEPDADRGQRATLDRLVERWQPLARYLPRIAERSARAPSQYRLAVTGSGITNVDEPTDVTPDAYGAITAHGLLWIGVPVGTHAGLVMLLGSYPNPDSHATDPRDWPLPLSRYLGVRIYDSRS